MKSFLLIAALFYFSLAVSTNCNASAGKNVLDSYENDIDDYEPNVLTSPEECAKQLICQHECISYMTFPETRVTRFFDVRGIQNLEQSFITDCLGQKRSQIHWELHLITKDFDNLPGDIRGTHIGSGLRDDINQMHNFFNSFTRICGNLSESPTSIALRLFHLQRDSQNVLNRRLERSRSRDHRVRDFEERVNQYWRTSIDILARPCLCRHLRATHEQNMHFQRVLCANLF